ncbi:MAG TPA: tRNA lysidine(34) synthetase TilS, partial [Longimicrobiaceae bacterium]|nr:tRNA lysidine(34) synthetase TilS [Longimicrobiaceae bacterium]
VRVRTELDEARVARAREHRPEPPDEPVEIEAGEPEGARFARIGGRRYRVEHRVGTGGEEGEWSVALPLRSLVFPLRVRGWAPGDRMRTAGGTKSLKKLFLEHRVPGARRHELPVLLDSAGAVLWVGGVPRPPLLAPRAGEPVLFLMIRDA